MMLPYRVLVVDSMVQKQSHFLIMLVQTHNAIYRDQPIQQGGMLMYIKKFTGILGFRSLRLDKQFQLELLAIALSSHRE